MLTLRMTLHVQLWAATAETGWSTYPVAEWHHLYESAQVGFLSTICEPTLRLREVFHLGATGATALTSKKQETQ